MTEMVIKGSIMSEKLYKRPDIYDIVYNKENSESLETHYATRI